MFLKDRKHGAPKLQNHLIDIGGQVNAFTSKGTLLHEQVLD